MSVKFEELIGLTIEKIEGGKGSKELIFHTERGRYILFHEFHEQDCGVSVTVEDICGSLDDLIGSKVLQAQEVMFGPGVNPEGLDPPEEFPDSFTWTFYKIATIKGYVTIRWYGASNGYYSESVSLRKEQ